MFNGLNNKLANVPTVTGLANIVADTVSTDTLIVDGNDLTSIIDQVPINTAAIAALQQITTDQTYDALSDTTTFDNNVMLTPGKTMTADNFIGTATNAINADNALQLRIENTNTGTLYYPTFVDNFSTGYRTMRARTNLSYNLSTNGLSCSELNALTNITPSNGKSVLFNGTPIGNGGNTSSVCMGINAGPSGTVPNNSFCFGTNSGNKLSSGVQNLCIGPNSGAEINTGRNNTFIGGSAGRKTTTGTYNTQIGSQSQGLPDENLIGSFNTTIGADCYILNNGLSYSTAIGAAVAAKTSNTVQIGRAADNTVFDGTVTFNNNLLLTSPATTLTPTELSYLDGATSNIQAQINAFPVPSNILTLTGAQTITGVKSISTGLSPSASCMDWLDTVTNNRLSFRLNAGVGAFNSLTQAGDCMILVSNTDPDIAGNITIAPWSSTLSGVRITRLKTFIGVGTTVKTAAVECEGSNVSVTGSLTLNNSLILTTPSTTLTQTELSYLDGATSNIQAQINAYPGPANIVTRTTVQTITGAKTFDGTVTLNNDLLLTLPATTLTQTELSYLDGATSNIQAQFSGKVNTTGDETIAGIKTFSSVPICATNATTSTQLTNKAYVDSAISGASPPANMVTTNTVQNITANKTMFGSSLLIDDGTGDNCTVSQTNQITHMKSNILQNTITITGIVPSQALNTVVVTDGTNPSIIVGQIITGGGQPLLPDWIVSSVNNYTMNVTTQGMPIGQVQLVNAVPLGTFFTSGIGTNFVAGTYITALVVPASLIYSISINALNTTLFKVSHTLKNITTNVTKASAIGTSTFIFSYEGTLRVYDKTSVGADQITMSISDTNSYISSPNLLMDNFYVGSGNTRNNVIIGTAVPSQTRFSLGNNTIVGNNSGNAMGANAVDNTFIGFRSAQNITSGNSNVALGNNSGAGITTATQCVFVGMNAGYQTATAGTGNGNTAVGFNAGDGLLTTASNNTIIGSGAAGALSGLANTFLGVNSGANVTSGSENICIGNGSVTTAATSSNEISIGRTSETMYIQGGFNFRVLNIIATGNITFPFPQFFTLTLTAAVTLTLPTVNVAHRGAVLKFKRNTGAFLVTITTTGGTALVFKAFNSIGAFTANVTLPAANFYTDLICDGSGWYQLTRT